ncbi:MAG: pantetheine-phosphate adenylyltransferase [Eubacteriaceae bacterium]|nr:pantetheine-phosphate adenylyltransferase [Eubacteriaceae bacterium]
MNKALYAGSFDPLTCGHLDLIRRAAKTCEKLVVGVIENPSKKPLFSAEERMKMIKEATKPIKNVEVDSFSGLLAEYVNKNGFDIVVRGLRGSTDFEYEIQMAQMNARLYEGRVETVFLMTDPGYSFISSSMAKEVSSLGGSIEGLVPDIVLSKMEEKFNGGK